MSSNSYRPASLTGQLLARKGAAAPAIRTSINLDAMTADLNKAAAKTAPSTPATTIAATTPAMPVKTPPAATPPISPVAHQVAEVEARLKAGVAVDLPAAPRPDDNIAPPDAAATEPAAETSEQTPAQTNAQTNAEPNVRQSLLLKKPKGLKPKLQLPAADIEDFETEDEGEDETELEDGAEIVARTPVPQAPKTRAQRNAGKSQSPVARAKPGSKAKVAMTLRLDHDRHFRLRLLSAHASKSAQRLLIDALDDYLLKHGADIDPQSCACARNIA